MNKHKRIARVIYNNGVRRMLENGTVLRNYMVLILPKGFKPKDNTIYNLDIEGGINLVGDYTTSIGYNSGKCRIEKPTVQDYLELAWAMKYKHAYKKRRSN